MTVTDDISAVRIADIKDIKRAAKALHDISISRAKMQVAPSHNIADRRTPVDQEGNFLAEHVFGWKADDSAWWQNTRIALDSPITAACRYESEVFWVNADGFRTIHENHHLDAIDLSNFEARAMTRAAIVVPIHLPFGQIGAVSFNPTDTDHTDLAKDYEKFGDTFAVLAETFIRSYVHVIGDNTGLPAGSKLSKREVECLRWAAIGKTDYEIGVIMSRSRATVRFHIHNAATKLDAVNRSQTVFKAAQLGYITMPK